MNIKRKSVAIICFSSGSGGMEHDAVKLAVKLDEHADVVLVCKQDSFTASLYKEGHYSFPCVRIAFTSRNFSLSMLFRVRKFLRKYAPANVVFFGASELKTLYFAFLGFNINLLVRHGTTKSRSKTDWFHRLIYSRVNYHIALSRHLLENVKKIVPKSGSAEYKVIYPSFNIVPNEIVSQDCNNGALRIVHVGRVVGGKGQIDAVYATHKLYEKGVDFQFDILGGLEDIKYVSALKDEITADNLAERVHMRGHITDVNDYLQTADIFLFPSAGEGMPNAFIEAMYYNVVCISYENTVFPEFSRMGFYIHIVNNGDKDRLSEKLLEVAENLKIEKEKAAVNVNLVKKYFEIERELADWDKVFV